MFDSKHGNAKGYARIDTASGTITFAEVNRGESWKGFASDCGGWEG